MAKKCKSCIYLFTDGEQGDLCLRCGSVRSERSEGASNQGPRLLTEVPDERPKKGSVYLVD